MPPIKKRAATKAPAKKTKAPRKTSGSKLIINDKDERGNIRTLAHEALDQIDKDALMETAADPGKMERLRDAYGGMFKSIPTPPIPVLKSSAYIGLQLIDFVTKYDHEAGEYLETLVLINDAPICYIRYENIKPFTRAFRETIEEFRR